MFAVTNEGLGVPTEADVQSKAAGGAVAASSDTMDEWAQDAGQPTVAAAAGAGEVFLQNIRERALIQWALVYLATAWALGEIVQFLSGHYGWPSAIRQGFALIAFAGFFVCGGFLAIGAVVHVVGRAKTRT